VKSKTRLRPFVRFGIRRRRRHVISFPGAHEDHPRRTDYTLYPRCPPYIYFFFHVQKVSATKIIIIMKLIRAGLTADDKIMRHMFFFLRKSFIMHEQRKSYTIPSTKKLIHLYARKNTFVVLAVQAKFVFASWHGSR